MNQHRFETINLIVIILAILLLAFGFGSIFQAYWTLKAFLQIVASAFFAWLITFFFEIFMSKVFGIRKNRRGDITKDKKFTITEFGIIFTVFQFLFIGLAVFLIDFWFRDGIEAASTDYASVPLSRNLGIASIVIAVLIVIYWITSETYSRKRKKLQLSE